MHPLKKYLKQNHQSQVDFAEKAGVTKEWLSDVIRGVKIPSFKYAQLLSDATDGAIKPHQFYLIQKSA